jgi:uncharacterized protein (UPF0333 family)
MIKHNQDGAANGLAISLIFAILLLVSTLAFGIWAFTGRQDYKDHTDAKIAVAVKAAKQQESSLKDAQFEQAEKNPLKTYNGPEAYGSVVVSYPKTWSAYIDDTGSNTTKLDAYFYPDFVPQTDAYALRFQVIDQSYDATLAALATAQQSKAPPQVSPYALPKVPNVVGVKVVGTLPNKGTGTMVILPIRSQTLEIWTDGDQFLSDFNNSILPNFSFSP